MGGICCECDAECGTTDSTETSEPVVTKPEYEIPEDCVSFYDGCNTCTVFNGELTTCTEMYCATYADAYCTEYESETEPTETETETAEPTETIVDCSDVADVDENGAVDVLDIVVMIDGILYNYHVFTTDASGCMLGDYDGSGGVDVLDVVNVVNLILYDGRRNL